MVDSADIKFMPGGSATTPNPTSGDAKPSPSTPAPSGNPFGSGSEEDTGDGQTGYEEAVGQDFYLWVDVVAGEVVNSLVNWGKKNGYSTDIMGQIYNAHAANMFDWLNDTFNRRFKGIHNYTDNPEGMQFLIEQAIQWFGGVTGMPLVHTPSGGGGGRGRSGPTAADIRNQFDLKELANMVDEMNRAYVFEDHKDSMGLARRYVDAVVATKGEKKIDFATFVEEEISKTARFKSIYRNKPEHLNPIEYMTPYRNAAMQIAAPHEADNIAAAGAQFGASAQEFGERLRREATESAPFIQGLEGRLRELNSVFKS